MNDRGILPERARLVQVKKFCELTGYTTSAVKNKIHKRVWHEGIHYKKAPDGHILIDMGAFERWADGRG